MPGKLYSWGNNTEGVAGDGYAARKLAPTQTITEGDWDDVQVGENFAVALKDGKLYSWGNNSNGPLGQGNTNNLATPTQIGSATDWESFSLGQQHVLAIKTNGTLWSWGNNGNGRTGLGTTSSNTTSPTQVGSDNDWKLTSAGTTFSLAIKDDNSLWSWGSASSGKLGNGTTTPDVTSPAQVGADTNWDKIKAGSGHSLAIKSDGTLWAWGFNDQSQLGTGNTTQQDSPIQIGIDTDWKEIAVGRLGSFSLAVKTTGTLWSWGSNNNGQTGRGTASGTQTTPAQVGTATDWENVFAGNTTGAAIKGGKLWGWGGVFSSSLGTGTSPSPGDGTGLQRTSPVEIDSNTGWTTASIGVRATSAFALRNGNLYFWGFNTAGVAGEGRLFNYTTAPAQIGSATDWDLVGQGSDLHILALRDGKLFGWGSQGVGALGNGINDAWVRVLSPTQVGSDTGWTQVVSSAQRVFNSDRSHSLGIRNGELYAWGDNNNRQLGNNNQTDLLVPTKIGSFTDWELVAAGDACSFGLRAGRLYSWGSNSGGRTGQGTTSGDTNTPTQIGTDTDWTYVAATGRNALAIKSNGTLWAWGNNTNGQLADGTTTERLAPVQIGSDANWKKAFLRNTSNGSFGIGIKTDGTLWSWGTRQSGQLGDGNTSGTTTSPTQVGTSTDWDDLAVGFSHSLALKTNGTLWAWGSNFAGALGDGTTTQRTSPVQIGLSNKWIKIAAQNSLSFAIETAEVAPANTAAPTITTADAILEVGSEMTSTDGTWTGTPAPTYAYQWQVSDDGSTGWANISGATSSSLTLVSAQGGKYVRLEVTATNTAGTETAYSAASAFIAEDPVSVVAPTITGTAKIEETLTADPGTWTGFPTPNFSYQWERSADGSTGWANISAATSATYELGADDKDKYVRVTVTGTNDAGTASASAEPAGPVQGRGSSTAAIVGAIRVAGAL